MSLGIETEFQYLSTALLPGILLKYPSCYASIKGICTNLGASVSNLKNAAVSMVTTQMSNIMSNYGLQCSGKQILGQGDILQAASDKMDLIRKFSSGSVLNDVISRLESASVGNIYVADTENNRIQRFNSSGTFISKWGSPGAGDGQFNNPRGIAVSKSSNNVFVTDTSNNRMQAFDSAGNFLFTFGAEGIGELTHPWGVALQDLVDYIYVTDVLHRVMVFDNLGIFQFHWGSYGSSNGQFKVPKGIACDSGAYVYVADSGNKRIQKFKSNGDFIQAWNIPGTSGPVGVSITGDTIYVTVDNVIKSYKLDGSSERTYAATLNTPSGTTVSTTVPAQIYVIDTGLCQIKQLTKDGVFVREWGSPGSGDGQFKNPVGITAGAGFDTCASLVSELSSVKNKCDSYNQNFATLLPILSNLDSLLTKAVTVLGTIGLALGCGVEMLNKVTSILPSAGELNPDFTKSITSTNAAIQKYPTNPTAAFNDAKSSAITDLGLDTELASINSSLDYYNKFFK